ncbi:MAG: hypothetical protein C4335_11800 [Armatimonadota bacterium]
MRDRLHGDWHPVDCVRGRGTTQVIGQAAIAVEVGIAIGAGLVWLYKWITARDIDWTTGRPKGDGWEWRGNGPGGSREGSWHNPRTGESVHPDLEHPYPPGPHVDYRPGREEPKIRIPKPVEE